MNKIAIVGRAGTGKGILAKNLAEKLNVAYISGKQKIYEILNAEGYDYATGIQVERFLAQGNRQELILDYLIQEEDKNIEFVNDKSVLDIAAYALVERSDCDAKSTEKICQICEERIKKYTTVFFCPSVGMKTEPNGIRTLNESYQYLIEIVERGLLNDWGIKYIELKCDNGHRVQEALEILGK